jgi:hypothetical protein
VLRSRGVLPVEFSPQAAEIRIKRDESVGALEKGAATSVV